MWAERAWADNRGWADQSWAGRSWAERSCGVQWPCGGIERADFRSWIPRAVGIPGLNACEDLVVRGGCSVFVLRRGGVLQPLLLEGGGCYNPPWVVTTKLLVTTPLTTPSNLSVQARCRLDAGSMPRGRGSATYSQVVRSSLVCDMKVSENRVFGRDLHLGENSFRQLP